MLKKKEFSKQCKGCGVEWLTGFTNKQKGRALCLECYSVDYLAYKRKQYEENSVKGDRRIDKMQPFKQSNREAHWRNVNKQLKSLKDKKEIREFISKQADIVFADKALMEYINHQALK